MSNNYCQLLAAFVIAVLITACDSRQRTTSAKTDDSAGTATATSSANESTMAITGRLADLGLTPDSHWRGINLGDDFSTVKATEKGEPFERDAKHVGYTVEFKNLESADMLYYQAKQKVSAVEVDLFLNARQSVEGYKKELESYFTARYRTPKMASGSLVWAGPAGETVTMKDVSKGKDFGLKIKIAPATDAVTASAK